MIWSKSSTITLINFSFSSGTHTDTHTHYFPLEGPVNSEKNCTSSMNYLPDRQWYGFRLMAVKLAACWGLWFPRQSSLTVLNTQTESHMWSIEFYWAETSEFSLEITGQRWQSLSLSLPRQVSDTNTVSLFFFIRCTVTLSVTDLGSVCITVTAVLSLSPVQCGTSGA